MADEEQNNQEENEQVEETAEETVSAPEEGPVAPAAESEEPAACPDCEDNSLAGAQAKGEPFPTGQLHPPAHPGCRCLLVADPA